MLTEIGSMDDVPAFLEDVKSGKGHRLMGFGHRVYKNYDPRATIIKQTADEVFEVTGKNPLLDIALKLEEVALSDDYFISRKLYPNVDFYSGLIYQALGFPVAMFTVLFAIPRTAGWLAHWQELLADKDQKISRPRQWYTGAGVRDYLPIDSADEAPHTTRPRVLRESHSSRTIASLRDDRGGASPIADAPHVRGTRRRGRWRGCRDRRHAHRGRDARRLPDRCRRQRVHRPRPAVAQGPGHPVVRHERQAGAAHRDHHHAGDRCGDRRSSGDAVADRRRDRDQLRSG